MLDLFLSLSGPWDMAQCPEQHVAARRERDILIGCPAFQTYPIVSLASVAAVVMSARSSAVQA